MGELSTARQALEGARLAPGNDETLQVLRDPEKRPPLLRETLSEAVRSADPDPFEFDGELFLQCVRSSRRGAAGGPSGMTAEHLQPIPENGRDAAALVSFATALAQGEVPQEACRITALSKPDGGVRGIVVGDILRRLVARTISKQFMKEAEEATAPYQYALSTRAGCECVAHILQSSTELDENATIVSVDGIGAYDNNFQTGHASRGVANAEWRQVSPILEAALFLSVHLWLPEIASQRWDSSPQVGRLWLMGNAPT